MIVVIDLFLQHALSREQISPCYFPAIDEEITQPKDWQPKNNTEYRDQIRLSQ
jgi:hypothetical protein